MTLENKKEHNSINKTNKCDDWLKHLTRKQKRILNLDKNECQKINPLGCDSWIHHLSRKQKRELGIDKIDCKEN